MKWKWGSMYLDSLNDDISQEFMSEMLHNTRMIGSTPDIASFEETRTLPKRLFELHREAMVSYDSFIAHNLAELEERGMPMTCVPGCSNCCSDFPDLNLIELINMYDVLFTMKDSGKYLQRMQSDGILFQKMVMAKAPSADQMTRKLYREAQMEYKLLGRPCAFLTDRKCDIYQNRPISCRMFISLSDPDLCDPRGGRLSETVTACIEPYKTVIDTMKSTDIKFGENMGKIPTNIAMGLCVLFQYFLDGKPIEKY